jgi:hypothetical protein
MNENKQTRTAQSTDTLSTHTTQPSRLTDTLTLPFSLSYTHQAHTHSLSLLLSLPLLLSPSITHTPQTASLSLSLCHSLSLSLPLSLSLSPRGSLITAATGHPALMGVWGADSKSLSTPYIENRW